MRHSAPIYQYGQFTNEHLQMIRPGIKLFNQKFYWECHECLEDLWIADKGDNARYVYWAIIQVAAAMIHVRDEKILGAQGMIAKAKEKIEKCQKLNVETDLLKKYLDWENFKEIIFQIPKDGELKDFITLYNFKFTPEPDHWEIEC